MKKGAEKISSIADDQQWSLDISAEAMHELSSRLWR